MLTETTTSFEGPCAASHSVEVSSVPVYTGYTADGKRIINRVTGTASAVVTGGFSVMSSSSVQSDTNHYTGVSNNFAVTAPGTQENTTTALRPVVTKAASFSMFVYQDGVQIAEIVLLEQTYRNYSQGGSPAEHLDERVVFANDGIRSLWLRQRPAGAQTQAPAVTGTYTSTTTFADSTVVTDTLPVSSIEDVPFASSLVGTGADMDSPLATESGLYPITIQDLETFESVQNERGAVAYAFGDPDAEGVVPRTPYGVVTLTNPSTGPTGPATDIPVGHTFPDIVFIGPDHGPHVSVLPASMTATDVTTIAATLTFDIATSLPIVLQHTGSNMLEWGGVYDAVLKKHVFATGALPTLVGEPLTGLGPRDKKVYLLGDVAQDITADLLTAHADPDNTAILPASAGLGTAPATDDAFTPRSLI